MNIILFIVVLSVLVFVHELGHFLFAKMTNTKVHSFAIGFEPTLFKKKIGETTYKLNLIPFGGYVRIHGQDDPAEVTEDRDRAYFAKPIWAKLGILIGGILFNLIFAWLLLSAALGMGTPEVVTDNNESELSNISTRILAVQPNSVSQLAGIQVGDEVLGLSFNGEVVENPSTTKLISLVESDSSGVFSFSVKDTQGELREADIVPVITAGSERPLLGLSVERVGDRELGFFASLGQGLVTTRQMVRDTVEAFRGLITDAVGGRADVSSLTGPVGLVGMVGDAASYGFSYLLFFTALISINLAVLNLIPFPALDGGQILFVLIEGIIRRPIPHKVASIVNMAGFAILILLMVSVTVFDVVKLL